MWPRNFQPSEMTATLNRQQLVTALKIKRRRHRLRTAGTIELRCSSRQESYSLGIAADVSSKSRIRAASETKRTTETNKSITDHSTIWPEIRCACNGTKIQLKKYRQEI